MRSLIYKVFDTYYGGIKMFRKGSQITTAILTKFFKYIYKTINNLSNRQLSQMTSGQMVFDVVNDASVQVVSDMMNVWSTQYFDNRNLNYYNVTGSVEVDYFDYYTKKLARL